MPKAETELSFLRETQSSRIKSSLNKNKVIPPIGSGRQNANDDIVMHKSESDLSPNRSESDGPENDLSSSPRHKTKKNKKSQKTFWKESLQQEERCNDKELLKRLNSRVNYLPNPRLEAARNATLKIDSEIQSEQNSDLVFELAPKCIFFNKYNIGKVYEKSFELRNTSKIAHQFRALPPKTQYFCLSLGMYPQGQSIIAPGLCATFNIRFAPDSLGTFEDEIVIECSNGTRLTLPVVAKRESPCLTSKKYVFK
jgi:hypothetical protein